MLKKAVDYRKVNDNKWEVKNNITGQVATIFSFIDYGILRKRYRVDVNEITVSGIMEHFQTALCFARKEVIKSYSKIKDCTSETKNAEVKEVVKKTFKERLYEAYQENPITDKKVFTFISSPHHISFHVRARAFTIEIEIYHQIRDEKQTHSIKITFEERYLNKGHNIYQEEYGHPRKLLELLNKLHTDTLRTMFCDQQHIIEKTAHVH
ncbi:hypothetical protein CN918_31160 [Priestia megaterium]|nr:hypothetical protein CN918_31160 [Priestia megaterium]